MKMLQTPVNPRQNEKKIPSQKPVGIINPTEILTKTLQKMNYN